MKDQKEALTSTRKPDITHARKSLMVYIARACEYGGAKAYERANYLRSSGPPESRATTDFQRLRQYLRAGVGHMVDVLDSMEHHQANDPDLQDTVGMSIAAYAADTDATPGAKVGASKLPHLACAAASLMMAIEQAVACELLPADPMQPWVEEESEPCLGSPNCSCRTGTEVLVNHLQDRPVKRNCFDRGRDWGEWAKERK